MLPAHHRLSDAESFRRTTRRGSRASSATLVAYAVRGGDVPRVGLVVSKAVGNAVARNRVKRRLRHVMVPRLDELYDAQGAARDLVVRALPAAAGASSAALDADITRALSKLRER